MAPYFAGKTAYMVFVDTRHLPAKEVINGYRAHTLHTGANTFVYWTVKAGAEMPMHSHLHHQVAHVLQGQFSLTVGSDTQLLQPGTIAVIPPHMPHGGRAITDCLLLDVFTPERDDYKFEHT